MSNDEIKELIQLVVESGIAELELRRGDERVRIRRTLDRQETQTSVPMMAPRPATIVETAQPAAAPSAPRPQPPNWKTPAHPAPAAAAPDRPCRWAAR